MRHCTEAMKRLYGEFKMIRKMRFQTKLLVTYSSFIIMLLSILGVLFYKYNEYLFLKNVESNLSQTTSILARQLDNAVKEMDSIADVIIHDFDIKKELSTFTGLEDPKLSNENLFNNSGILQSRLETRVTAEGEIYRVSIFNSNGNIISTKKCDGNKGNLLDRIHKFTWLEDVKESPGQKYIREPHYDDWLNDITSRSCPS